MLGRLRTIRPGSQLGLLVLSGFALVPVAWMFLTALRPRDDVPGRDVVPDGLSLGSVQAALDALPFGSMVLDTTVLALAVTAGQVLTSLLAAYAFARWRFRGDRLLFGLIVASWLVPFQVTMIPNYVLLSELGWLDRLAGVIVPQLAAAVGILLLRQHLRSFPKELLDAARLDGLGSWATLWRVVVPNLRAPLAALSILVFVSTWNEYLWPLLVLQPDTHAVLQVGLASLLSEAGNDYGALMAATGLASLPILVLYVLLQRQVTDAFVRSGLR
jgi:ABC-type glycerol-3-phosphate transport system permease component